MNYNILSTGISLIKARVLLLKEFLTQQELSALLEFTLRSEAKFEPARVVLSRSEQTITEHPYRRARVLFDIGIYKRLVESRVCVLLPHILQELGCPNFPAEDVEVRITASNDGDFFRVHSDNCQESLKTREISFVYYYYREPKGFSGGELRVYDTPIENGPYMASNTCKNVIPRQNQIVFFQSVLRHEVMEVHCPSRLFGDSRFTINGWIRSPAFGS
jgi:SM-20-related protein